MIASCNFTVNSPPCQNLNEGNGSFRQGQHYMTILIRHKTSAHPASISAQTTCLLNHDLILHSVSMRISLVQASAFSIFVQFLIRIKIDSSPAARPHISSSLMQELWRFLKLFDAFPITASQEIHTTDPFEWILRHLPAAGIPDPLIDCGPSIVRVGKRENTRNPIKVPF